MIVQRIGVPIYLQVKNHILDKINSGEYPPGMKIPTEREFSAQLGISRNTVSTAYKELLLEGVLEARQGRGTFVKGKEETDQEVAGSKRERLIKVIDEAMAKVVELGFTVDQFVAIASIRAKEKAEAVKQLRVAVVDDAEECIQRFVNQLSQVANVRFEAITTAQLKEEKTCAILLDACDIVVAASEYQGLIASSIGNSAKVVNVATAPNLDAVIKLARLPVNSEVGILARTPQFVDKFINLIEKMAVNSLRFQVLSTDDTEEVHRFITCHKVLVVSEEREHMARRLAVEGQDIITFYYEIDRGSLNQVMLKLVKQGS